MEQKDQKKKRTMEPLIRAYEKLPTGTKAELRRLNHYEDVRLLAGEAFWKTCMDVATRELKYSGDVIAAMLILFLDRGANADLAESSVSLGKMFAGEGDSVPVKIGRFKRLMSAGSLDAGFTALRPLLRLFRHEKVNWTEVAEFLNALRWEQKKQMNFVKKRLSDEYYQVYLNKAS